LCGLRTGQLEFGALFPRENPMLTDKRILRVTRQMGRYGELGRDAALDHMIAKVKGHSEKALRNKKSEAAETSRALSRRTRIQRVWNSELAIFEYLEESK
jgi:hypothetical protein